jgi:hypothetical protein
MASERKPVGAALVFQSHSLMELHYLINHVFLPPQLPQKTDAAPEKDVALTKEVLNALQGFHAIEYDGHGSAFEVCISMVKKTLDSRAPIGTLLISKVKAQMGGLSDKGEFFKGSYTCL